MGRIRKGAVLGVVFTSGLLAMSLADCASPTQIVLDIRSEQKLCANGNMHTGVAVTTPQNVDLAKLQYYEEGCEAGSDRVGTLTITPGGANDSTIGVRIVGAVSDKSAEDCGPNWSDCILARRTIQFIPGKTVNVTVLLREACIGKFCNNFECSNGACVRPDQIQPDAAVIPAKDGEAPLEDVLQVFDSTPIPDVVEEKPPILPDACVDGCNGGNANCNGVTKECRIACTEQTCKNVICKNDFKCFIDCPNDNACKGIQCASTENCQLDCRRGGSCENVTCSSAKGCDINCNVTNSCRDIWVDGGQSSKITCKSGDNQGAACERLHCRNDGTIPTACQLSCETRGQTCKFGDSTCSLDAGCVNWDDGGDGGPGP